MEFTFNLKSLKAAGFVVPTEKRTSVKMKVWSWLTLLSYVLIHLLVFLEFLNKVPTVYAKVITVYHIFNGSIVIFRRLYFIWKKDEITALLELIAKPQKHGSKNLRRQEFEMKVSSTRKIRRYSILTFSYTLGIILGLIGLFLVSKIVSTLLHIGAASQKQGAPARLVLYIMWWPTNLRATPTYYFIIAWQSFTVVTQLLVSCTTDAFTCSLMLAAAERSSLLARLAPQSLMPGTDGQINRKFKSWVKFHQHYLRIIEQINSVAGPLILVSHFCVLMTLISISYVIIKVGEKMMATFLVVGVVGLLIQLSIISRAGQKIIDNSADLSRSILGAQQVAHKALQEGPTRSALSVIITRLSGGCGLESISGLGFFVVSLECFSSALSGSVSYILFLLQFKSPGPKEQKW